MTVLLQHASPQMSISTGTVTSFTAVSLIFIGNESEAVRDRHISSVGCTVI